MFSKLFLTALVATLATVHADPNPSAPGPGDTFREGGDCSIAWDVDTTGTWKEMAIELMSGSNLQMNHITTVATVDGTDATKNSFTYPCPDVTPNSAIYFYQFTSPASKTTYWTTRFTIADNNGHADPPANPKQANGDDIPWGIGALADPSKATPPPPAAGSGLSGGGGNSTQPDTKPPASSPPASSPSPSPSPPAQQQPQQPPASKTSSGSSSSSPSPTSGNQQGAAVNKDASAGSSLAVPVVLSGALAFAGALML